MRRFAAALALVAAAAACGEPRTAVGPAAGAARPAAPVLFQDVTVAAGIDFVHRHGGSGRKYMPEIMGSGAAALDYDGDGRLDLYLVQAGRLPGDPAAGPALPNRFYRNLGGGRFADVTERSGAGHTGYGMGAVAGDVDNDGDADLYLANFGPDALLRNNGDGTFTEVTAAAGIDNPLWGSSATFLDADGDGWLDLYVVNYVDFSVAGHIDCGQPSRGLLAYCHPDVYPMAPDRFFRNRGDGTFVEATASAGLTDTTGKGLGVVSAELTGDGRPDLYVANDSTPNFLYRNLGGGRFEEAGLLLGVGHNEEGRTEAGMGTAAGDVDGDGWLDLIVTNLDHETNSLYLGGELLFRYATREAGLYDDSFLRVGFGTDLADFDNDGDLDLVVVNGHIIDNVEKIDEAQSFRQPAQLFWNDGGGRFAPAAPELIAELAVPRVGRGTVTLDFDDDGRLDLLVSNNDDRARLFANRHPDGGWIGAALSGGRGNRDAVGARLRITAGSHSAVAERLSASSYQSSGDPRVHFGLGPSGAADRLEVRWPGGRRQAFNDLRSGRYYRLSER